jgi:hypothetical protein
MNEADIKALEGKYTKGESNPKSACRRGESLSCFIGTDEYGSRFYANYKRVGFAVTTESGSYARGDTIEEAIKNVIPIERTKNAYWKAFFVCRDTGRRPRDCPFFNNLMRRDAQSDDDDEPSESFSEPLVDAARETEAGL